MFSQWKLKIEQANKAFEAWEQKFNCAMTSEYYEGQQWRGAPSDYKPYMLNLIFAAINTKLASNLLQNPSYEVSAMPGSSDWNYEFATQSAQLKEDVLNTLIKNPNADFTSTVELVALEHFFRFGVLEVEYSADWRNPSKKPVVTKAHDDSEEDPEEAAVLKKEDIPVPSNERIYFKHIPAKCFRVVTGKGLNLDKCSWCGYWEYVDNATLINADEFNLPEDFYPQYSDEYGVEDFCLDKTLIWKIWDHETLRFLVFVDGHWDAPIFNEEYEHLPFMTLRGPKQVPDPKNPTWYPIPVVSQWMSQQDEANESREQMRNIRRRGTRKWQVDTTIDQDEVIKFQANLDGTLIFTPPGAEIKPILNPEMGVTLQTELLSSKDDFNHIAAVSEARQSDRTTATQAKINATREAIRESAEQADFRKFLADIGRLTLIHVQENFSEGMWIELTADPGGFGDELADKQPVYQYVTAQEIQDGYDFTVKVNVINETPEIMEEELKKFVSFLSLLMQFPALAMDPNLIAEAAAKSGYRNMRVIRAMQRAALVHMIGMATQAGENANAAGVNNAKATVDNSAGNAIGEIQSQMQNQLG